MMSQGVSGIVNVCVNGMVDVCVSGMVNQRVSYMANQCVSVSGIVNRSDLVTYRFNLT